jgi:ABC-2 type transport system ATP-binding protein
MTAISSDALSKVYRSGLVRREQVAALNNFSITVESGQIFSLLGPNGAGKTTFIKILLSLAHSTSGSATILGEQLPNVKVKSRVGYLPENHRYPGYLTGEQVLSFFGRLSGVDSQILNPRIRSLMELVGMSQWTGMNVKKYSKGMMQRLGLAQALINDPEVIFLDEPTDGVDPVGRKEIRDILRNLKQQGKTIFLNSHLLSEVELISDRVAILDKGKLLKVGTVDELTASGLQYHITVGTTPHENARQEIMKKNVRWVEEQHAFVAEFESTAELNAMIDLLRKYNVEITSIYKQKNSLEESFINLLKREVAA